LDRQGHPFLRGYIWGVGVKVKTLFIYFSKTYDFEQEKVEEI